ncbi:prephenate dehydrogenase/arogenate dehydrogenase family protein [Pseudomonas graminis]|uniref:prephenate dehydrogenase n=1 Tax=Pseudomonas graminis TaxID=158627 RepID=UPI00234AA1CC|nr:prephenate dehydrogenase/arogenate dehydrogenase family protein [Pseudomonas graminis]MDC6378841.1 prephenate dehydrogenase/arogenate dehydrogenase family protein [Pseudomonas graminis]
MESIRHLGIVGLGLLGSSILRGVKLNHPHVHLHLFDGDPKVCREVEALGLVQQCADSLAELHECDLVVVCVPTGSVASVVMGLASGMKNGAVVTDVGSAKQTVINALGNRLPTHVSFVPGHPMAGGEQSGPSAGREDLFAGKTCLLVPLSSTPTSAIELVERFWRALGAITCRVDARQHDHIAALTSHLPHLIAFSLMETFGDQLPINSQSAPFIGRSFFEQIRLASSDVAIWTSIFENNTDAILSQTEHFIAVLNQWCAVLQERPIELHGKISDSSALANKLLGRAL